MQLFVETDIGNGRQALDPRVPLLSESHDTGMRTVEMITVRLEEYGVSSD
jgi:hypothetical protein